MRGPGRVDERKRTRGGRRRMGLGAVGLIVVAGVLAIAIPAWAHFPEVSGETVCSDGNHLITWTIGNSETDKVMTITSASASDGTNTYAVTGYSPTVGDSGSTTGTTTVPGGVTGTVTLTVTGSWTDGVIATRQTSVELIESCAPSTTTSTTASTSTTISPETSTVPVSTTTITEAGSTSTTAEATTSTSIAVEGTTVLLPSTTADSPSTTVAPAGTTLPFTGGSFFGLLAIGASCLIAGALALVRRRRRIA